ncbi:SGNH/GDSL hydrolase family protein [Tessaracoccus terricola]
MIEVDLLREVEIRGAVRVERTERGLLPRRLTAEAFRRLPDRFMRASVGQSAGIRLALRTDATTLRLRVHAMKMIEDAELPLPEAWYEVTVDGRVVASAASAVGSRYLFSFDGPVDGIVAGPDAELEFTLPAGGERELEIWLPYTDEVEVLGLRADRPVMAPGQGSRLRWLHHGSSISHGYLSSRTTTTWPVVAANRLGLDLTSLGFSGNAMLDQLTARTIRDTAADLISVKLGINVVNGDHMRRRVFRSAVQGFLDTIRDGHPTTPLLVVSPVCCPPVEDLPGPTVFEEGREPLWVTTAGRAEELAEGKLSLAVVREELAEVVAQRSEEDPFIGYLDGSLLYGSADAERLPMPDNLHPDDSVSALIASRFAELVRWPGQESGH